MSTESLKSCLTKLEQDGASDLLQRAFTRLYSILERPSPGLIGEDQIKPVSRLNDIEALGDFSQQGKSALDKTVVLKLNGGLGTGMGLDKAKSLLTVKDGLSFLEIIAKQVVGLREKSGSSVPLILMNSFRTEEDSINLIEKVAGFRSGQSEISLSFLQNRIPKVKAHDLSAARFPENSELEWCPPGHGDIYTALIQTGLLEELIAQKYRYLFVSNADNLGASLDLNLLGYFAQSDSDFMMEVADRTESDKKGGHLALTADSGKLLLREVAQCPEEDLSSFQDISRHKFFNTNSLWLDLEALAAKAKEHHGVFPLPVIRNEKNINPADPDSEKVIQLETAMGSAIEIFEKASAIRVPRSRFLPVKKTNDLLVVQSDVYQLNESHQMVKNPSCASEPIVELDPEYFKTIEMFQSRFPEGVPSMVSCEKLKVRGDVTFGANVTCSGVVTLSCDEGSCEVPAGSEIDAGYSLSSDRE